MIANSLRHLCQCQTRIMIHGQQLQPALSGSIVSGHCHMAVLQLRTQYRFPFQIAKCRRYILKHDPTHLVFVIIYNGSTIDSILNLQIPVC